MVKLYVLPTPEDQLAFAAGQQPRNCFMREFDSEEVARSYLKGLRAGGESNVVRESYLEMVVVFGVSENEEVFHFGSLPEKDAFRQGLEDGEGLAAEPVVHDAKSESFAALEAMFASEVEPVFIQCEEGSLGLLKSFGAKLGPYDLVRRGVMADVSGHVLSQIRQFPADFEVEFGVVAADEVQEVADATVATASQERGAMLVFLRQERAQVTTVGVLSVKTTLPSDVEAKEALIAATTEWVSKTEAGRKLWTYSSEDLNIGDLASSGAFSDETFLAALRKRGVEFAACMVGDTQDAISYDQVLVDVAQLEVEPQMSLL